MKGAIQTQGSAVTVSHQIQHKFETATLLTPVSCAVCKRFIWGFTQQAVHCVGLFLPFSLSLSLSLSLSILPRSNLSFFSKTFFAQKSNLNSILLEGNLLRLENVWICIFSSFLSLLLSFLSSWGLPSSLHFSLLLKSQGDPPEAKPQEGNEIPELEIEIPEK